MQQLSINGYIHIPTQPQLQNKTTIKKARPTGLALLNSKQIKQLEFDARPQREHAQCPIGKQFHLQLAAKPLPPQHRLPT